MNHGRSIAAAMGALLLTFAGCSHAPEMNASTEKALDLLEAKIEPTQGNTVTGWVRFAAQKDGSIQVVADLSGLTPNATHAIHVHEKGDCTAPDAMSAGAHYNPEAKPHGIPPAVERHAGDLGNLTADAAGNAHYVITVTNISLSTGKNPILGKAVIVHAKPDDGSQPAGNAGARLGCGEIEVH
jgi:Cu-Zn family superoxide dismutase